MNKVVGGEDPMQAKVGEVPVPESENQRVGRSGYHDFYVAYDPATHQDKYYGAGAGGYYVYDVSNIHDPKLHHVDHGDGRRVARAHVHT